MRQMKIHQNAAVNADPSPSTPRRHSGDPMLVLGPHDVPFTQYLRPDGRRRAVCIERPPAIAALAQRVIAAGYHFDIEELRDGTVSMTCEPNQPGPDGDDAPIAHGLCGNGPPVPIAVDRMIERAADALGLRGPASGAPAAVDERSTERATAESTGTL